MILSYDMIETYAISILESFRNQCHVEMHPARRKYARATRIEQFAEQYMNLELKYTRLSGIGDVLGLTAYADTEYRYTEDGVERSIPLLKSQILLDTSLAPNLYRDTNRNRRRFTIAHECAHQILFRMENAENRAVCRKLYSMGEPYSLRDLKSREDWNEWQANALAAALLMPSEEIKRSIGHRSKELICYEGRFTAMDRHDLDNLCHSLLVSRQAMTIRLRQLGYLIDRPIHEFYDPLEVLA